MTPEQQQKILIALGFRNADFLKACIDILDNNEAQVSADFSFLYQRLAADDWSKIDALDYLLKHTKRQGILPRQTLTQCFDIEHIINFRPEDNTAFISFLFDFAAERPPTPDEALQFDQLLRSGKEDRRDLLFRLVSLYSDILSVDEDRLMVYPKSCSRHLICRRWREQLIWNQDTIIDAPYSEDSQCFLPRRAGPLFRCDVPLDKFHSWRVQFKVKQQATILTKLVISNIQQSKPLVAIEADKALQGEQFFEIDAIPATVRLELSVVETDGKASAGIYPEHISIIPEVC